MQVNPSELKAGIAVEMEHTKDPRVSERISLDHLSEFDDYYTKLHAMEGKKPTLRRLLKQKIKKSEDEVKIVEHLAAYIHPADVSRLRSLIKHRMTQPNKAIPSYLKPTPRMEKSWKTITQEADKINPGFLQQSNRTRKALLSRHKVVQKQEGTGPISTSTAQSFAAGAGFTESSAPPPAATPMPQASPPPPPAAPAVNTLDPDKAAAFRAGFNKEEKSAKKKRGLRTMKKSELEKRFNIGKKAPKLSPVKMPKSMDPLRDVPKSQLSNVSDEAELAVPGKGIFVAGENKGKEFHFDAKPHWKRAKSKNLRIRPIDNEPFKMREHGTPAMNARITRGNKKIKILRAPTKVTIYKTPELVDANKHTLPFSMTPEQMELHHGVDIANLKSLSESSWTQDIARIGTTKNKYGKQSIVKGHMEAEVANLPSSFENFTTSHREVAYHNIAKDVFSLGKYVPLTSGFKHGVNYYSAQEWKKGKPALTGNDAPGLSKMFKNGDLHRVAFMNTVLGNHDRHHMNFLLHPDGIYLIDNALAFGYGEQGFGHHPYPSYINEYVNRQPEKSPNDQENKDAHLKIPASVKQWAQKLDAKKLGKMLQAHGAQKHIVQAAMANMTFAKDLISTVKTLDEFVKGMASYNNYGDEEQARTDAMEPGIAERSDVLHSDDE